MLSLTGFNLRFTPSLRMFLLTLLVITFFMRLGFWQLQRAHEKQHMLAAQKQFDNHPSLAWSVERSLPKQYQLITVKGRFLPTVFLLDNQLHHHQFGYDVLSPLELSNGEVLLVNRGWVAADVSRQTLPKVTVPSGFLSIQGSAYYFSKKIWVLGPVLEKKQNNTAIIERVDVKIIEQFLHKSVYPFIIRLNKNEANGFTRDWAIVSMPPQRHYGYAVQWFAMALVVLILFIGLNIKRN